MKLNEVKVGAAIWILWLDSIGNNSGWHGSEEFSKRQTRHELRHRTVGFLLEANDEYVTTCGSRQIKEYVGGNFHIFDRMTIPKCAVLRWGFVKIGESQHD